MTVIGQKIKVARSVRGVTQKQLASKIGASQSSISNWELGREVPSLLSLAKIALALGCDLEIGFVSLTPEYETHKETL